MNILCLLRNLVNQQAIVTFEEDWQGNTLTISIKHPKLDTHTHVGFPDCSEEDMLKSTTRTLNEWLEAIK